MMRRAKVTKVLVPDGSGGAETVDVALGVLLVLRDLSQGRVARLQILRFVGPHLVQSKIFEWPRGRLSATTLEELQAVEDQEVTAAIVGTYGVQTDIWDALRDPPPAD
jgi:hypothetical protein